MRMYTRQLIVYTFTKLHDRVHKYCGKTIFGAKNEEMANRLKNQMWHFCDLLQN